MDEKSSLLTSSVLDTPSDFQNHKPLLDIQRLSKKFGDIAAVDQVSFSIDKGHIFALLGPSGCGKSTLLRMLAGFEIPTDGKMLLEGQDITTIPAYARPINMMFQSYALFPHLSVWDNIAFGLRRSRLPKDIIADQVKKMLQLVQLTHYAKRFPHQLSGGQQQRVALARSLAKKPKLLLLDEPLGALDRKLREQTQWELTRIIKSVNVTCVLVTHDQEEAMTMADSIAVMSEGDILQIGKPHEIYETPANRFVADFIGNVNLLDGQLIEDGAGYCVIKTQEFNIYVGHGITGNIGMLVSVALRPEKIEISREEKCPQYNAIHCTILGYSYFGHFTVYILETAKGLRIKVSYPNTERDGDRFSIGETVQAYWDDFSPVVLMQ